MRLQESFRQHVAAVKEAVSRSASRERNSGDQSDLEVIDAQTKADVKPSSIKTPDTVPQKIENPKEIPEITLSSPESSSQDPCNNTEAEGKAGNSEPSPDTTPAETPPQEANAVEEPPENTEAPTEPLRWDNLWEEAYEGLKINTEYADLLADFEQHLLHGEDALPDEGNEGRSDDEEFSDATKKLKKMQTLAQRKLDKLPEARLSFTVGNKKIDVRETVRKTVDVITTFKDIINPVVSAEPCSAVTWGGIMAILPLVENALQQDDNAASGLEDIVFLLIRYRRLQEEVLAPETQSSLAARAREVFSNVRSKIIDIYTKVYVYEIRFVLQYGRSRIHRTTRDMVVADGWKEMWASIESSSQKIDQAVQEHVSARSLEAMNDITTRTENIEALQRETLESVEDGNRTSLMMSLNSAPNAIFDSAVIVGAEAACLKGTQKEILNTIQDWAENPAGEIIFWLHGMAGTGKTSVALAVANALKENQPFTDGRKPPRATFLGASFFFKQGDRTRNTTKRFFTTLARSLAQEFEDLRVHIANAVAKNLDIGSKAPQQQLNGLVFQPLSIVDRRDTLLPIRLIVVVDALDECIGQQEVDDLISMLRVLENLHRVQLRALITSRRDEHIHRGFKGLPERIYRRSELSKVRPSNKNGDVDDITFYLIHTLGTIASKRGVPPGWIDQDGIAQLSRKADGLFIYAATLCRFLDTQDFTDEEARRERLDQIFTNEMDKDGPQQKVDEIYVKVLSFSHVEKLRGNFKKRFYNNVTRILGFIAVFFEPASIASLSALLPLDVEKLEDVLRKLYSVLDVREDRNAPLALVHLSFRDFLLDEMRSGKLEFKVSQTAMHRAVFERCLRVMSEHLSQNMCGLVAPAHPVCEIPTSQVEEAIPRHLRYACRYWVDHLAELPDTERREVGLIDNGAVHIFLQKKVIFWLEAMSLIRETTAAVLILNRLQPLLSYQSYTELAGLVYDVKKLLLANKGPISEAPLQLYASALVFSPAGSQIRSYFKHLIPPWIVGEPKVEKDWSPEHSVLETHTKSVNSTAFSPVDNLLVSGSLDGTTRVWDYVTGTELYKFEEFDDGTGAVWCVAFSTDGKRVASAVRHWSGFRIRVRDIRKGTCVNLNVRTDAIQLMFAAGTSGTLISRSIAGTVSTWNVDTKREIDTFEFLPGPHKVITLSPTGEFAASESEDKGNYTVRLWSVKRRKVLATLGGHRKGVRDVAISMDGATVVTVDGKNRRRLSTKPATKGHFVKVWDTATGNMRHKTRYDDPILKVVFCTPKSKFVAIATGHGIVELRVTDSWHTVSRVNNGVDVCHYSFSSDGSLHAAGYNFGNIRLWEMGTNSRRAASDRDHNDPMISFGFVPGCDDTALSSSRHRVGLWHVDSGLSWNVQVDVRWCKPSPDGNLIVLGTAGTTDGEHTEVQIWTRHTKRKLATYNNARSATFSPDSSHIALRSDDIATIIDCTTFEQVMTIDCKMASSQASHFVNDDPLVFSPNGRTLCWRGQENDYTYFHMLDLRTRKKIVSSRCTTCTGFKYSSRGDLVAVFAVPRTERLSDSSDIRIPRCVASLIETGTGKERRSLGVGIYDGGPPSVFGPDSSVFVTNEDEDDGTALRIFDTDPAGKLTTIKRDEASYINALGISATGKIVAASVGRGLVNDQVPNNIQVWDIASGIEVCRGSIDVILGKDDFGEIALSSDCRYLSCQYGRIPLAGADTRHELTSAGALSGEGLDGLYFSGQWLHQGFHRLLWIPPAYRELQPSFRGKTVALGNRNGIVTFLTIDLARTPIAMGEAR